MKTDRARPANHNARYEHIEGRPAVPRTTRYQLAQGETRGHPSNDPVVIERLLNGEPAPEATDAEKYHAARWLNRNARADDGQPMPLLQIAKRVGTNNRNVQRWSDDGWVDRAFTWDGQAIGPQKRGTP